MESARAAIVTGASSGIGLAVARMLGEQGHAVTLVARRPEKLEAAYEQLRDEGLEVQRVAADVGDEADVVARRRRPPRRLRAPRRAHEQRRRRHRRADRRARRPSSIDLQLATNLRSIPLFYRESLAMLTAAGAEHRNALVVNTASIAGKQGQAWLSVYSATKFGVVGFTQAMNQELSGLGIKSTALCPGFVDTPMTDFVKDQIAGRGDDPDVGHRRRRGDAAVADARAASSRRSSSSGPAAGRST